MAMPTECRLPKTPHHQQGTQLASSAFVRRANAGTVVPLDELRAPVRDRMAGGRWHHLPSSPPPTSWSTRRAPSALRTPTGMPTPSGIFTGNRDIF